MAAMHCGPMRILIVDDDDGVRLVIREVLAAKGCILEEARDGDEALAKVVASKFDLVLLDQHMPGTSGPEVADFIRSKYPATRIVVLTGSVQRDELQKLAGFALLLKPFATNELLRLVG